VNGQTTDSESYPQKKPGTWDVVPGSLIGRHYELIAASDMPKHTIRGVRMREKFVTPGRKEI
jgi:hypothetical protein